MILMKPLPIALLLCAACHPATAQSVSFAAGALTLQGAPASGATSIANTDINGDSSLDLVVSKFGFREGEPGTPGGWNNKLEVFLNNGSGGFTSHTELTVG